LYHQLPRASSSFPANAAAGRDISFGTGAIAPLDEKQAETGTFSPFGVLVGRFGRDWAHKKRRRFPEYVRFCEA
jgi:hypothetical protein